METITYEDALISTHMCSIWDRHLDRHNEALLTYARHDLPEEDRASLQIEDLLGILDRRQQDAGKASIFKLVSHHIFNKLDDRLGADEFTIRLVVTYERVRTHFGLLWYRPAQIQIQNSIEANEKLKALTIKALPNIAKAYEMLNRDYSATWTPVHQDMVNEAISKAEHRTATKNGPTFDWLYGYEYADGSHIIS
jgi:hypothetical protein